MKKRLCKKVEVWKITDRRDNAIFKTERVGFMWIVLGQDMPYQSGDFQFQDTTDEYQYFDL